MYFAQLSVVGWVWGRDGRVESEKGRDETFFNHFPCSHAPYCSFSSPCLYHLIPSFWLSFSPSLGYSGSNSMVKILLNSRWWDEYEGEMGGLRVKRGETRRSSITFPVLMHPLLFLITATALHNSWNSNCGVRWTLRSGEVPTALTELLFWWWSTASSVIPGRGVWSSQHTFSLLTSCLSLNSRW